VSLPALGLHVSFELNTTSKILGSRCCHITHPSLPHTLCLSLAGRGLITRGDFAWMQENPMIALYMHHTGADFLGHRLPSMPGYYYMPLDIIRQDRCTPPLCRPWSVGQHREESIPHRRDTVSTSHAHTLLRNPSHRVFQAAWRQRTITVKILPSQHCHFQPQQVKNSSVATSLPTAHEAADQSTRVFRII